MNVAVFVGTRADLGPLAPVIRALADAGSPPILLCGVAFNAAQLESLVQAEFSGHPPSIIQLTDPLDHLDTTTQRAQGRALADGIDAMFRERDFDRLVVLGDRWELLYVTTPFFLAGIPIVHLHGGEVTEGAIDDRVRHAVTKLADVHCVASPDAERRVRQLGEPADRVHLTGAPGLARFSTIEPASDAELATSLDQAVVRPFALFTYHPPTTHDGPIGPLVREALVATASLCGTVLVTHPGFDVGRDEVLAVLTEVAAEFPHVVVTDSLGPAYPRILAAADVVVGNSSSGVIEAASAGRAVVDIGDRQKGRLRGDNVISSADGTESVTAAVRAALTPEFQAAAALAVNPYGDASAPDRIAAVVLGQAPERAKPFVDLRP